MESQLLPRTIKGRQEPVMRTRRLDDSHGRRQAVAQGKTAAAVKHRRLGQRAGHLVRALGNAVGSALQGFLG